MANSMASYEIIDEPKVGAKHWLIMNPVIILFVAILLPLVWEPPLLGRFWMPFIWLMVNSYLLGSPSFTKECIYSISSIALIFSVIFFAAPVLHNIFQTDSIYAYVRLLLQSILFVFLYIIVFTQSPPYEIYQYMHDGDAK